MPHGFFTIEEWRGKKKQQWVAVCHLNGDRSLTDAMHELERQDKPCFFPRRANATDDLGGEDQRQVAASKVARESP